MNVFLKDGFQDLLPTQWMQRWVQRSDLTPVPRNLEFTIQLRDGVEALLPVGGFVWTGIENLKYEIVKTTRLPSGVVQGSDEMALLEVHALLASCAKIAFRRDRAVIKNASRLGDIYRSCGATLQIADDINVSRFACLVGQVPSFYIAQAMQEAAAAIVLRDGRISMSRYTDLFRQKPKDIIGQTDTSARIESEFLERHEIPMSYSVADDGSFVLGSFETTRRIAFLPKSNEQTLRNTSRVLVTRRVVDADYTADINAGDLITVVNDPMLVITAAHVMEKRDGAIEDSSRFWVGDLSE